SSIMASYLASAFVNGGLELSPADNAIISSQGYSPWALSCAGAAPPAAGPIKGVLAYEGGYQNSTYTWMRSAFVSSVVSNASPCVLQLSRLPAGLFVGGIVWWQGDGGGGAAKWTGIQNFYYSVTAVDYTTNQVTINLDCSTF